MDSDQLLYRILDAARIVHSVLGPGFVESIYSRALAQELRQREFHVDRERIVKIWYTSTIVGKHRFDLVVDDCVIIELKACRTIIPVHLAQMQSYLHASSFSFGIVLNFGLIDLQWEVVARASDKSLKSKNPEAPYGSSGFI
jgi:GxxExxY protein